MNIKRIAYDEIIDHLRREISRLNHKLDLNKYEFKKLVNQQTNFKRQRTELVRLINVVEGDKPKERKEASDERNDLQV